jgi:hypothetical protein
MTHQVPAFSTPAAGALWPQTCCAAFNSCAPQKLSPEAEEASQELDKLLNAAAKEGKLEKVYKLIEDEFENASHRNVTTAFCKLAKLAGGADAAKQAEITSTRSFQMLVDMVLLGARRYTNGNLLAVMDSCGKLGFDDDMLLDKVTTRLLTSIHDLSAAELHSMVTSLGQLSSPSVVLAEALQQRAEELGGDLSDTQKKELAEAFEKLGYSDLAAKAAP